MSAEAQAKLACIWKKLHFSTIKRTVAREPEDISSITVYQPADFCYPNGQRATGHMDNSPLYRGLKRLADVPEVDLWRTKISWSHYYGFTDDGIYFQRDGHNLMDFDLDLTLDFGTRYGNHQFGGYHRPEDGQLICGEVVETPKGKKFIKWFPCDEAFMVLVAAVLGQIELPTEERLGQLLLTDPYPDMYWAVSRLVLFDDVQAFVNDIRYGEIVRDAYMDRLEVPDWAKHPGSGRKHGKDGYKCSEGGMFLPKGAAEYVHMISFQLNQPQWWQEFLRLTAEQGVSHSHPSSGGVCDACVSENYDRLEFPDWENGWHDSQFQYSEAAQWRRDRAAQLQ